MFHSYCILLLSLAFIVAYPVLPDDSLFGQSGYEIYERLKSGDPEAWEVAGPDVVDLVHTMIENGEAKSPVHALLRLFWPELTNREEEETLRRVEPMVRNVYNGFWKVNEANNGATNNGGSAVNDGIDSFRALAKRGDTSNSRKSLKDLQYVDR